MPFFTVTIALPAALNESGAGRFSQTLDAIIAGTVLSVSLMRAGDPFHGPWKLQWLVDGTPDPEQIIAGLALAAAIGQIETSLPDIAPVDETINWLEQSYRRFPPFSVPPFFIHGSHYTGATPPDSIPLCIDAATAFGSGEHGTTGGCLHLLGQLHKNGFSPSSILDMGCGSGILSVAAKKLWPEATVLAVDIDPEAVRVTQNHCARNHVAVTALSGGGFSAAQGPYDLVLANILPGPLKAMAQDIARTRTTNSFVLLSGMLLEQTDSVLDIYKKFGFSTHTRLGRGEWASLLLT